MRYVLLFVAGSALLLALIKNCDPARHRSIYRHHGDGRLIKREHNE